MKDPFVVATSDSSAASAVDSPTGWYCLLLVGAGVTVVALLDLFLLFVPPRWSSLEWEFGTIGQMFESLPLVTLGIGIMASAAMATGWQRIRTVVVTLSFLMSLAILILGAVFALDFAPELKALGGDPQRAYALKLGSLKTGLEAAVYFLLYLALGVWTRRRTRRTRAGGTK